MTLIDVAFALSMVVMIIFVPLFSLPSGPRSTPRVMRLRYLRISECLRYCGV